MRNPHLLHFPDHVEDLKTYRVNEWLHLYLDGVVSIAQESIDISKKITVLRETDMRKLQALGKREATSGVRFLQELFKEPLTSNSKAANTMKLSRSGAIKLVERFTDLGILYLQNDTAKYGRTYAYQNYISIFNQ